MRTLGGDSAEIVECICGRIQVDYALIILLIFGNIHWSYTQNNHCFSYNFGLYVELLYLCSILLVFFRNILRLRSLSYPTQYPFDYFS